MDGRVDLEQQLWEFVYELLPEDEAEVLRGRIAADPEVARLHDEVCRKAAIVAQAARVELPPIPLAQPSAQVRSPSGRRWANWLVALAASLLLCYLGFAGFRTRSLERSVADAASGAAWADQPVRTVVFGSPTVQPALANYFAVQTQTAAGAPRAAAVNYRVLGDDGTLLTSGQVQSDASGFAQFQFRPATPSGGAAAPQLQNVSLELEPETDLPSLTVRRTLPLATPQLTTYLSLDRTIYRPGERVRCRTVTLDRATLEVVREVPVEFRMLDADGQPLGAASRDVLTQHGVASAEFELPRFQPGGAYKLVAASPADAFPEARRDFVVRPYLAPSLRQRLNFARDSYHPGEEVEADLRVERADGEPAGQVSLAIAAETRGWAFYTDEATTDDQGVHRVRFRLPDQVAGGDAVLSVTAGNEAKNRIEEQIPVQHGVIRVEFRPESGELVHGVTNRVYFFAHDALDKPVHIQGRVVDDQEQPIASVQTIHDGRGVFEFQPERGRTYRLALDPASGTVERPELPPVSPRQFLTLNAAPGVFAAGRPLKVRLLSNTVRPVAVSAVCRGVVVGQQLVSPARFSQEDVSAGLEVVVPVADTAEGVIRVTAYDYAVQPPEPIAERLVFRRPTRKLELQPQRDVGRRRPGESVEVAFSVKNERGHPLSAVLGASVVDEAALSLARDRSASLTTHFWLTGQIDDVRGLEDANLYLAAGAQAEQALDLLLGTQGWRRFLRLPADQLAQMPAATQEGQSLFAAHDSSAAATVAVADSPAVLIDNAVEATKVVRSSLAALQTTYQETIRRVGVVVIVGSLILALALALLAVKRRLPAATVWLPALGASALSLVLGFAWLATESRPGRDIAKAPAARAAGEVQVAQVDELDAASGPETAAPSSEFKMGKAGSAATERWYGVENVAGKGGGLAPASPPAAEPAATADFAPPAADGLARQQLDKWTEQRKGTDSDSASLDGPESQPRDKAKALPPRTRSLPDRAAQVAEESLQQDMPTSPLRAQRQETARPLARDMESARGAVAGRAAGVEGRSEPARRLKGAPSPTPRPAATAAAAPAPAEADQVPAALMDAPLDAIQASPAAPTPAAPVPAAAPIGKPQVDERREPAPSIEPLAESAPKAAAPSQLGLGMQAEPAAGQRPAVQSQVASDAPAAPGGLAGGMGGARDGFGGGASAAAPFAARGSRADLKQKTAEKAEQAAAPPLPALERAPAQPAEPRDLAAERESLKRGQTTAASPADQQLFFRQYASRRLAEQSADSRSAPPETVYWEPLLVTDAKGQATIQFRLPDTATTYRVLVDGHAQGRIGSYLGRIVVQPASAASD